MDFDASKQEVLGSACAIFLRPARKPFFCSIKYPRQPRFIKSLQTSSVKEARVKAARLYWLSRPSNESDAGPTGSLIFLWNYWQQHHPNHRRMKTIQFHMERKFLPLLGDSCSMESSPLLEKEITGYCKQRTLDGRSKATIRLELQSLMQCLRFAKKRGIIESVVSIDAAEVELAPLPSIKPKKKPVLLSKSVVRSLPATLNRWCEQSNQKPHHQYSRLQLKYASLLMLSTGVPPKTLTTLRNYCLEFSDDGGLDVLVGFEKHQDGTRKHHRIRAQFLSDYAKPIRWMKQWMEIKKGKEPDDLLFSNPAGGSVNNQLSELFSRFIRDNDIQPRSNEKRLSLFALKDVHRNHLLDQGSEIPTNYMKLSAGRAAPEEYIDPHRNDVPPALNADQNHIPPHIRFDNYKGDKCWQVLLKEENYESDLEAASLTPEEQSQLRTSDFSFSHVPSTDKKQCNEVREFLKKYEWLSTVQVFTTSRYIWRLNIPGKPRILSGVLCFSSPNQSQDFLKDGNSQNLERLISRGATNAISPKNMASHMLSGAMKHMVKTTPYKIFTGYADPTANETGTVYQATSFMYLGSGYGSHYEYLTNKGWQGSKVFTERSAFVRHAKQLNIEMKKEWFVGGNGKRRLDWSVIPTTIAKRLRAEAVRERDKHQRRKAESKSKYAFVLGRTRKETKRIRSAFIQANADLPLFEYPKE